MKQSELQILNNIAQQAHFILNNMIYTANYRKNQEKGDPKVGGHCSASTSALHILGALHLVVKSGYDHIANKPHASPADHAYNYLLNLLLDENLNPLSHEQAKQAMRGLRAFPEKNGYSFQSYHSIYDPDNHHFLPSGTVGIPPVVAGYLALAYRAVKLQGYQTPQAHFWAIIGDSEFREGSLMEAIPDLAEREIGNLTWILDYNRQSLDGHRLVNTNIIEHSDATRIEKTLITNGWEVINLKHGSFRKEMFKKPGGKEFQNFIENELTDHEFQALFSQPAEDLKKSLQQYKQLKMFLENIDNISLKKAFTDLGGHDFSSLISAMKKSKEDLIRPSFIIAHTIKGWGLEMAGLSGNHSYLISKTELDKLRKNIQNPEDEFPLFKEHSAPGKFLQQRREKLHKEIIHQNQIKKDNESKFKKLFTKPIPNSLSLDFQKMSYPHTQWFLGQVTAKLARIAQESKNTLKPNESAFKEPGHLSYTLSPDVGTSTNLGFSMNNKTLGPQWIVKDSIKKGLEDKKSPNLITNKEKENRFIRFEIAEANSTSCMAAFGKMRDILGVPILPIMTIYDFFIKRALDQYFYALYWNAEFILCGTPSGVTLSPEGAQHGWKSDFQIPNQITWEPCFIQEMDWIFADALKKHFTGNNKERKGVLIRAVTRGLDQTQFMKNLKTQKRFKADQTPLLCPEGQKLTSTQEESQIDSIAEEKILSTIRNEVLAGAYHLLNYKGYADFIEDDNVVHVFSMGSLITAALEASKKLLAKGVYANVIVVTSPDLLLGNLGQKNNYTHLRNTLALHHTKAPIVSVHDGEPGLLDNIGSILGVYQETLAVRKHSRSGRPKDIYQYHGIDATSIYNACLQMLQWRSEQHFARRH